MQGNNAIATCGIGNCIHLSASVVVSNPMPCKTVADSCCGIGCTGMVNCQIQVSSAVASAGVSTGESFAVCSGSFISHSVPYQAVAGICSECRRSRGAYLERKTKICSWLRYRALGY